MNPRETQFESRRAADALRGMVGRAYPRAGLMECGDTSPLLNDATCRVEPKRGPVRALPNAALRTSWAFSLIEMMVTVALLTVIILGLVAMFNQTRRAFVSSMTQVDVLESGRMAADMIARDVEQMTPTYSYQADNLYFDTPSTYPYRTTGPLLLPLSETANDYQVNNLEEAFFITRYNLQWNCIGYKLSASDYGAGIGTLYRFGGSYIPYTNFNALTSNFLYFTNSIEPSTNGGFSRVIDGVVDFRLRVYDTNGVLIGTNLNNPLGGFGGAANTVTYVYPVTNYQSLMPIPDYMQAVFASNSEPAYVELELGVLEDRALAQYKAISVGGTGPGSPGWAFLTNHAGQVHIFRQRIPIRNVNTSGYP